MFSGSSADTTIVLLDRSPSMSQTGDAGTLTKRDASKRQLVDALKKLKSNHYVLIESDRMQPRDLDEIDSLLNLPETQTSSTSADFPAMLDEAAKYVENNKTGRTDIWISSDLRVNDWKHRSTEWKNIRDKFMAFPQSIRFHLFGYSKPSPENMAIQVTEVERLGGGATEDSSGGEVAISLKLSRESATSEPIVVPIQFDIEGARSQASIELVGKEAELRGHRIPIDAALKRGWGRVSIPADTNTSDDQYFFSFDKPHPRKTVLVSEDIDQTAALQFAAETPPNAAVECQVEIIEPHQVDAIAWESVALLVWQAALPKSDDSTAKLVEQYIGRGGQVVFFPPGSPTSTAFMDVSWTEWKEADNPKTVTTWTMDQDLLANSISGISLPVGEVQTLRYCPPEGELTTLATLDGGDTLLSRLPTSQGGAYFCSTTTSMNDSTLASNGAVLYVALQRALANGASVLGKARQATAGSIANFDAVNWKQLAGSDDAISTDYEFQAGVYQRDDRLLAVNRHADENHASILSQEQLNGLFDGLDFSLVQNEVGSKSSLVARNLAIVARHDDLRIARRSTSLRPTKSETGNGQELDLPREGGT